MDLENRLKENETEKVLYIATTHNAYATKFQSSMQSTSRICFVVKTTIMCKKIVCILIAAWLIGAVKGQDNIRLILEFKMMHVVDTTQRTNPRTSSCMLLVGARTSVFDDYYRSMRYLGSAVSRIYNNPSDIQDAESGITSDQIYIDFEKRELITGGYFSNTLYAKKEPIEKIEWMIVPQKKQILQQECQMATATFRGRHYTAWFAPAIPINSGPWKLNGLPGIILAANDDKNEVSFTCTKISKPEKNAPPINFSKNAAFVSAAKFEQAKKTFNGDPMAGKGMSNDKGTLMVIGVSPGAAAAMQPGANLKRRRMNNPIEIE
jgi:GLPGLI family protein